MIQLSKRFFEQYKIDEKHVRFYEQNFGNQINNLTEDFIRDNYNKFNIDCLSKFLNKHNFIKYKNLKNVHEIAYEKFKQHALDDYRKVSGDSSMLGYGELEKQAFNEYINSINDVWKLYTVEQYLLLFTLLTEQGL